MNQQLLDLLDAAGSSAGGGKLYVEDVFSTYTYTGTGSSRTIANGIDLAGKGGMVWVKVRDTTYSPVLFDTSRGANVSVLSDGTFANTTFANSVTGFNSTGFSLGSNAISNGNGKSYASWTFREAPKFFDVVTYTGTGSARTIAHSLGVAPGCIIVKRTDTTSNWAVYHRSANRYGYPPASQYIALNSYEGAIVSNTPWNDTAPTSTNFTVGADTLTNANGGTYVAYVFAHDATADGIIQCGSFTPNGSGYASVSLGWEPQWLMVKNAAGTGDWWMFDNMRGFPAPNTSSLYASGLLANTQAAESPYYDVHPTSTGFTVNGYTTQQIYIAIRRGPMKTPTSGTSVFSPVADVASGGGIVSTGFPIDLSIASQRTGATYKYWEDRLRGVTTYANGNTSGTPVLNSNATYAEDTTAYPGVYGFDNNVGTYRGGTAIATASNIFYNFRRAPGFFDEVCYTGTGAAQNVTHGLGVAPELIIVKARSISTDWAVYAAPLGASGSLVLSNANPDYGETWWQATSPTSTTFRVNYQNPVNGNTVPYVAYLFASCPGVSKVGSFTGNGSSQTINCGFAAGARFVMIKRTDSTGDWYVWDTARGMVAANDPHLSLNTTAAEVTTDDSVDTDNTGFIVNQVSATNVNVNGATYIYLAVA